MTVRNDTFRLGKTLLRMPRSSKQSMRKVYGFSYLHVTDIEVLCIFPYKRNKKHERLYLSTLQGP